MKRSYLVLAGLLSLAACNSPTTSTPATDATVPAKHLTSTQAVTNSPGTAYLVYRGLLPGQADSITLHLVAAPNNFALAKTAAYVGSYYGTNGRPYSLSSEPAGPDSVVLFDTSPERAVGPTGASRRWRLRWQSSGLMGTVAGQPVQLRLLPPATPTFAVRYFTDSTAAFPGDAKSPQGHFSLQALVPIGGPASARQVLENNMLRDLRGDSLGGLATLPLPAFYEQKRQKFFQDYREDAAASRPAPADTAGIGPYGPGLGYENQTATYVLYQQGNLLSLGYYQYDFSGGAHGNYGTTTASYDLRTGQRLRYADIFRPEAAQQLPALLGQAVRPLVGLHATEPLDKQLFVKQMPVTHNVFLTGGGVVFTYQPYEIAAYAQGEVSVFLPLSAVRMLLREGLPLPEASPVAKR